MAKRRLMIAMTAASGAGYCLELLKGLAGLRESRPEIVLITNESSRKILKNETGMDIGDLEDLADRMVDSSMMDDPAASGSNPFDGLVICPCTVSTASKIASGIADNLITRCGAVALKERRTLILAVRETPLSTPVLGALFDLSSYGAVIMPAAPPLYGGERTVEDLQKTFAGRILDVLNIDNDLAPRYAPKGVTEYPSKNQR
ncbi:MAG: UbiX family flavin prenyltransferase [Thermoplasmatota archaeon]